MFSYRHAYHAGNFADVVKHVTLTLLLQSLQRKETAFCFLDTHAGIGRYDLHWDQAQQTGEYRDGISLIWEASDPPAVVQAYLQAVHALNRGDRLRYYPGSPRIARHLLRPQDRMVLGELNPYDHAMLDKEFAGDRQVRVHQQDAYQSIKAFLPPKERRGLVLIDPAFELKDEYRRLASGLKEGHRRWPTGIYAVWYPVMSHTLTKRFKDNIAASGIRKILCAELTVCAETDLNRMHGSGMLIINPPWQLDEQLNELLPWLWRQLSPTREGGVHIDWLVPE